MRPHAFYLNEPCNEVADSVSVLTIDLLHLRNAVVEVKDDCRILLEDLLTKISQELKGIWDI